MQFSGTTMDRPKEKHTTTAKRKTVKPLNLKPLQFSNTLAISGMHDRVDSRVQEIEVAQRNREFPRRFSISQSTNGCLLTPKSATSSRNFSNIFKSFQMSRQFSESAGTLPPYHQRPYHANRKLRVSQPLEKFARTHAKSLPVQVEVTEGYFGETADTIFSSGDILNVHCIKQMRVIKAKTDLDNSFKIPLNSEIKFGILYNPNSNEAEAMMGFTFETVADIIAEKKVPKVVCSNKDWFDVDNSVSKGEILILQDSSGSQWNSDAVEFFSITQKQLKILPQECGCNFSTTPSLIPLSLLDMTTHLSDPFPCRVNVHNALSHNFTSHDMFGTLTLTGKSTEKVLLASFPVHDETSEVEIINIPVGLPDVEVTVLETSDETEKMKMKKTTRDVMKQFDLRKIRSIHEEDTSSTYIPYINISNSLESFPGPELDDVDGSMPLSMMTTQESVPKQLAFKKPFYSPLKRGMETLDDRELYCTNSRSTWSSENTTEDSLSTSFTLSQLQSDVDELCRVVLCLCESVEQMEARQKSIMQSLLCAAKGGINGMTTTTATDKQHGRIKALRTFSEDQVCSLLESLGLKQYKKAFQREQVDGEILCELDEDILEKELGVRSRLHRIRMMKVINGRIDAREAIVVAKSAKHTQV